MTCCEFTLPTPPSCNRFAPRRGNSSDVVQRWWKNADAHLFQARYRAPHFEGAVEVVIVWSAAGFGKHDADNFVKATLDYLTRINVWHDDKQVYTIHVTFDRAVPRGYCRISVRSLQHECQAPPPAAPEPSLPQASRRHRATDP